MGVLAFGERARGVIEPPVRCLNGRGEKRDETRDVIPRSEN